MENIMETTIVHWGLYGDNGKENGNHYSILRSLALVDLRSAGLLFVFGNIWPVGRAGCSGRLADRTTPQDDQKA